MDQDKYKILISKFLSEDLTPREKQELDAWIKEDKENLKEFLIQTKIWNLAEGKEDQFLPVTEAAWRKLSNSIEEQEQNYLYRQIFRRQRWLAAAAALLLLAAFVFIFRSFNGVENVSRVTSQHADVFYLPDSSIVWLDKSSELVYPEEFSGKTRTVRLKGHAYFKVRRNTEAPFIVLAGETKTMVLGTAFDLTATENLPYVEIIVSEGKVLFSSQLDKVVLEKNEKGVFEKESKMISKVTTPEEGSIAWILDTDEFTETSEYKKEQTSPVTYLKNSISWKRNLINQTVIDGYVTNTAILTSYTDVVLKVSHFNSKGKKLGENHFTIQDTIQPGHSAEYKYRLTDWFENTREVYVEIEEAKPVQVQKGKKTKERNTTS